jgi:hypothetical protein
MPIALMLTRKTMKNLVNKITKFYTGLTEIHHGGFSFTISDYFDIIASFRILSVVAIPTLAFA